MRSWCSELITEATCTGPADSAEPVILGYRGQRSVIEAGAQSAGGTGRADSPLANVGRPSGPSMRELAKVWARSARVIASCAASCAKDRVKGMRALLQKAGFLKGKERISLFFLQEAGWAVVRIALLVVHPITGDSRGRPRRPLPRLDARAVCGDFERGADLAHALVGLLVHRGAHPNACHAIPMP